MRCPPLATFSYKKEILAMAGASMRIDATVNDKKIRQAIQKLLQKTSDVHAAYKNIGEHLIRTRRGRGK